MEDLRPPKPRLTLRVGVTGHRLEALQDFGFNEQLLRFAIREILVRIRISVEEVFRRNRDIYSDEAPVLRIVSPLAEGADQFVAQEGRRLGFEIQSPLPIDPKLYKEKFVSLESKSSFDDLLGEATSVFVIDDSKTLTPQLYEAVGRVVLRQSDLLIAVWNGVEEKGQGGTGQVVREALSKQIPTVWISANPPHSSVMLERITEEGKAEDYKNLYTPVLVAEIDKSNWLTRFKQDIFEKPVPQPPTVTDILDGRLKDILEPPGKREWQALRRFLSEHQPEFRVAFFFRAFCRFFVPDWPVPENCELEAFETAKKKEWTGNKWEKQQTPNNSVGQQIESHYRKPFLWADVIADICADRYRSAFVTAYILGALAVLAAFLGSHKEKLPSLLNDLEPHLYGLHGWFSVELVFITGILVLVSLSRIGHWHDRWIDYRLLAEGLRQMRVLALFARVTPSFEAPAHLLQDATNSTWFNWYFRAIVRHAGLARAEINKDYLDTCREILVAEIDSQIEYHKKNEKRNEELHGRLHGWSIMFFIFTFIACFLHLFDKKYTEAILGKSAEGILTLCAIVLPAFGAAIQGIIHQGESGRLARRSGSIRRRLEALLKQLTASRTGNSFKTLGRAARSYSEIQLQEQTDWRSVFRSKDVSVP